MKTREEALQEVERVLGVLNDVAEEDWIAESFIPEALVVESGDEFYVDMSLIFYGIREMGEDQLYVDFKEAVGIESRV